jgi:rSAM/selenodomain-associated transferase 1
MRPAVAVIAKAPVPGRVKTRLCPPFTPAEAAALAEAALRDTLAALRGVRGVRRAIVLDGAPGPWLGPGIEVVPQRGGDLGERLAGAFADLGGPALVVGMDTPQVTPAQLRGALAILERRDAVLGSALDGGYWAIGLAVPDPRVFAGVPMSRPDTAARQRARLRELGLSWAERERLRDVDDAAGAHAVAAAIPGSAFARALGRLSGSPAAAAAGAR